MNEETMTTTSKELMPEVVKTKKQYRLKDGSIVNESTLRRWELTSRLRAELRRLEELPRLHAYLAKARRERRRETLRVKRLAKKHGPAPVAAAS